DDVDRSAVAGAIGQVAPFDVADEVEARLLEQGVRFLRNRVSFLRLLADAEESDRRVLAAQQVFGVDGAEARELKQLVGRAIDVGARVENDDRLARRWEMRGDGRPLEAGVK